MNELTLSSARENYKKKKKNVETANSSQNHLWKHILQSIRWAIQWRGIEQ